MSVHTDTQGVKRFVRMGLDSEATVPRMKQKNGKGLPDEDARHLRAFLEEMRVREYDENASAMALALDYSHGAILRFLSGETNGSVGLMSATCRLFGVDRTALERGEALAESRAQRRPAPQNFVMAWEQSAGMYAAPLRARVLRAEPCADGFDPPVAWWMQRIQAEAELVRLHELRGKLAEQRDDDIRLSVTPRL